MLSVSRRLFAQANVATRVALSMSLLALCLAAAGCGSDSNGVGTIDPFADTTTFPDIGTPSGTDVQRDVPHGTKPDAAREVESPVDIVFDPDTDEPPEGTPTLEFVDAFGDNGVSCAGDRCVKLYESVQVRSLEVLVRQDGARAEGIGLRFTIEDDHFRQGELVPANGVAVSGADGVAQIDLKVNSVEDLGQFAVKVAVLDDPYVRPIFFDVVVDGKGTERDPLTVMPEYAGPQQFDVVGVYVDLFRHPEHPTQPGVYDSRGLTCTDLETYARAGDENMGGLTVDIRSNEAELGQSVSFQREYFLGLEEDGAQMYTIFVYGKDRSGVTRVVGCDDQNGLVSWETSRNVRVPLWDLPPRIAGTYEVESHFDLISGLPENVANIVYRLLDFFQSPTDTLLSLFCLIDNSTVNGLCSYIYNDGDPDAGLTMTGGIAVGILDTIIGSLVEGNVWGDVFTVGGDVGQLLTNLTFKSRITIFEEPDLAGRIREESVDEEWNSIEYRWTLGMSQACQQDPDCGVSEFSFAAIQTHAVSGQFNASLNTAEVNGHAPFTLLSIDDHPLGIEYGALLNYLIKNIVLPAVTGVPQINRDEDGDGNGDAYANTIAIIVGGQECYEQGGRRQCCQNFEENILGEGGIVPAGIISSACESLTTFGGMYVEAMLTDLNLETGSTESANAFLIGTPAGEPCVLYGWEDDLEVDSLGRTNHPCYWNTTIKVNVFGLSTDINIRADFIGRRM